MCRDKPRGDNGDTFPLKMLEICPVGSTFLQILSNKKDDVRCKSYGDEGKTDWFIHLTK